MSNAFICKKYFESHPASLHIKFSNYLKIESENKCKILLSDNKVIGFIKKDGKFFFLLSTGSSEYKFQEEIISKFINLDIIEISEIIEKEEIKIETIMSQKDVRDAVIFGDSTKIITGYNWYGNFLLTAIRDESFNIISNERSIRNMAAHYHSKLNNIVQAERCESDVRDKWLAVYKNYKKISQDKYLNKVKSEIFLSLSDNDVFKLKVREFADAKGCRFSQSKF